ncbi:unnamed protein product [Moneuplotes crassus]|uniref:Uncharacterized protein n=1 Tax=Euplotes crassus TaxID=5936 RepID=A0AAD1XIT4_EUPCR|nr:unnamed protein product [Moneuplotes crassus]
MVNLAIKHNLSSLILKMVEDHPQEMVQVYNSNKTSSMLHDLASIGTLFTQDEIDLAQWLIKKTDKFSKNIFGQTFLETAIHSKSPNFDLLAQLLRKRNSKPYILRELKKTSLRENLYRNVLKHCPYVPEKLIRMRYYYKTKQNCTLNSFESSDGVKFCYTESLLVSHTKF